MDDPAPLILTLALDHRSLAFFDRQRRRYFPRERNVLTAHLTLFHKLPAERVDAVVSDLQAAAAGTPPFALEVTGLRSLGRGVAYTLASPRLAQLRLGLAKRWAPWLTLQDRQRHQPHVTVQNKVDPAQAHALLAELAAGFAPFQARATGLDLWRYRGGPWEKARGFRFTAVS